MFAPDCVGIMAVQTRNRVLQERNEGNECSREVKRPRTRSRRDGGREGQEGVQEEKLTPGSAEVCRPEEGGATGSDDIILIRKRMSACRQRYREERATSQNVPRDVGEKGSVSTLFVMKKSPDDVGKFPRSLPTDEDEGIIAEEEKQTRRKKTKSRVRERENEWLPPYRRLDSSNAIQDVPEQVSEPTTFSDIPDSCLVKIMSYSMSSEVDSVMFAKNPCMSVYPLVCKRWKQLLASPSELWNVITIDSSIRKIDTAGMRSWILQRQPSILKVRHGSDLTDSSILSLVVDLGPDVTSHWQSLEVDYTQSGSSRSVELLLDGDTMGIRFANLTSLSLIGLDRLSHAGMESLRGMRSLNELFFNFNDNNESLEPFEGEAGALPDALLEMTWLKSLKLHGQRIKSIQPNLAKLKYLEELRLENISHVGPLPLLTARLHHLKMLSLKGSKFLFESPTNEGDGELGGKRMFWIIRSLPHLEELCLDGCGIKEIPIIDGFSHNTVLKKLSMDDNPDMVFKKGLAAFQGLEHLSMKRCNMPCISSAVSSLQNLKYLDISNNGLVECHGLGKLKKLEKLKASHNQFPCIPRDLYLLSNLRELELFGCIYLEFTSCMKFLCECWPHIDLLDLRKGPTSRYQNASIGWLKELDVAWQRVHQKHRVVRMDEN